MENSKIKGLFFDFDGVLTKEKYGSPTMVSYIADKTNLSFDIVDAAYGKYNKDLLLGNITHKDMWKPFCKSIGQDVPYEILVESFMNITLDERIIDFIKERHGDYFIGMITDNKADRIEEIVNNSELKSLFDGIVISSNVHSRKSDKTIFEEALIQSGLSANECVFIDNTLSNLTVPNEMGFKTVYFDDEKRDYEKFFELVASL